LIAQGAVEVAGQKITEDRIPEWMEMLFHDGNLVIKVGKRRFAKVVAPI
jgi:tyrosyl-tRNA synthetase